MAAGAAYASSPALYECIYRYDMTGNHKDKPVKESSDCILLIGEDRAKFYDYSVFKIDSVSAIPSIDDETVKKFEMESLNIATFFDQELNTSLPDGKLTVFTDMAPGHYRYEQKLPLIEWQLAEDTDTVCGYVCRKAEGEYGGRQWTAWYAEEIAVPFGPWKIGGLPGLALKAEDNTGEHSFRAIAFRQGTGNTDPSKIPNQTSISHDKLIELKNRYDRDPFNSIDPESISDITVHKNGTIIVNGAKMRQYTKGLKPLEYSTAELKKIANGEDPYSGKKGKGLNFDGPVIVTGRKI